MKILLCSSTFEHIHHGPAKFANLILEINALYPRYQVRVLTEDASETELTRQSAVYKANIRIPRWLKPLGQVIRMFQYYHQALRVRNEYPYDVLVFNNAFIGLWAAVVSKQPTVGMVNDEKNLLATLGSLSNNRQSLKQYVFRFLERLAVHRHDRVIANSEFLTKRLTEGYRLPPGKVKRLYKAIDLERVNYVSERTFGSPVKVLFVKADFNVGRLDLLVKALERLRHHQFILSIIGPEKRFEQTIRNLCSNATNVAVGYLGPQPQAVVYQYLYGYDLFCVPSATEALGVANIEALAAGIPVISTRVGGIPEVLDQGNNGWLVEPGDPAALADAIRDCIADSGRRRQQSENGLRYIRRFSKETMFASFIEIITDVVEECN